MGNNYNFGSFSNLEKCARKSVLTFWIPQRKRSFTEWMFDFIYLGTKFMSPQNIEKLSNLHAHDYNDMLVTINSDRIKIAQYQWKVLFSPIYGRAITTKRDQWLLKNWIRKNNKFCWITSAFNFVVTFVHCLIPHDINWVRNSVQNEYVPFVVAVNLGE